MRLSAITQDPVIWFLPKSLRDIRTRENHAGRRRRRRQCCRCATQVRTRKAGSLAGRAGKLPATIRLCEYDLP
jgi:hypothetical protein